MIWDGLKFFGFDDTKLPRLKGIPPKFTDKFFKKSLVAAMLTSLSIALYVIINQTNKLG